jgi:hypothetical protein
MMWNPWMFGLEAVQQGWQAQSALAFRLMRPFAGGVPDQTTSSPLSPHTAADDIKAQEEVAAIAHVREAPAAIIDGQEAPVAIADARVRRARIVTARLDTHRPSPCPPASWTDGAFPVLEPRRFYSTSGGLFREPIHDAPRCQRVPPVDAHLPLRTVEQDKPRPDQPAESSTNENSQTTEAPTAHQ